MTVVNKYSKEFRERFLKVLEGIDCDALYFSGGMDSTTILFGLLELGRKPFLISFKQKDIESKDHIIGTKISFQTSFLPLLTKKRIQKAIQNSI